MSGIYTTKTAAAMMELNKKTVQRLCRNQELKAYKKLSKWYILHSDILEYIKSE